MIPRLRLAIVLLAAAGSALAAAPAESLFPGRAAAYLVQVDGATIASRDVDRELPPASLTKIMTAVVFIESGKPLEGIVVVSPRAARATGTRLGLKTGEKLRAADAFAAMLLNSANDACLALAEHVGSDKERFALLMNQRARDLGLTHTHFTNPCGHDEPRHHSSARDLAVLARAAMAYPQIAALVSTVDLRIATLGGRRFDLVNKNELVGRYEGAIGIKSGFTPRAGKCLMALAQRNGVSVLLIVLNARNRWWDTVAALDQAFAQAKPRG